jgi:hypothetical protein
LASFVQRPLLTPRYNAIQLRDPITTLPSGGTQQRTPKRKDDPVESTLKLLALTTRPKAPLAWAGEPSPDDSISDGNNFMRDAPRIEVPASAVRVVRRSPRPQRP